MPTLMNVVMNGSDAKRVDAKMVEKVGVATIVANKATWPATVQSIDRHPEDESIGNQGRTRRDKIKVEIAWDGSDPTPKPEKGPQRPRRHFRRPGGGRPQEELNTTISANKPEENSTLGGVNVEGTEPEHASLFTLRGRICACCDDSFDFSVEFLVDCEATSDFISMQTAKRARLPLYKLRNPGHVLTAGGVYVEVRYCTRAYIPVGELVFRHHFKVLEIPPDVVLPLPWLPSYNPAVNWKERYADIQLDSNSYPLWFWQIKPATVSSRFEAGPSFDTFIQCLESESGWKSYPTCQGTPQPTLVDTRPAWC